jgi:hypothetical protein
MPLVLLLLAWASGFAVLGQGPTEPSSDDGSLVSDVVRMLEGGVSSPAIAQWLRSQPSPIPALTPEEMIRLSKAGASDEVMQTLNRMSAPAAAAPESSPAPRTTPPPPPPPVPLPVEAAPREPASAAANAAAETEKAGITFALKYKRPEDTGEQFGMLWTLWVYVDGEPITYSRSQSSFLNETVETFRWLRPGQHVLRLLHESHVKKKNGYQHESQVMPDAIYFQLEAGDDWTLELTYLEKTFAREGEGPVSWELKRGREKVDGRDGMGHSISDWPPLCDDMQANVPEGKKKPPGWIARKLEGCLRWSTLSAGVEPWPSREEVRAAMEAHSYKPPRD